MKGQGVVHSARQTANKYGFAGLNGCLLQLSELSWFGAFGHLYETGLPGA